MSFQLNFVSVYLSIYLSIICLSSLSGDGQTRELYLAEKELVL